MTQPVQYPGLESWASRVRNELASATGMAEFNDRVQQRGFDWMTSFVDSVLSDEPIVEIAKTPGRQKSAKKTRSRAAMVAASAAKIKALNDGTYDLFEDKENALASPTRDSSRKVQRALFAAQENEDSDEENDRRVAALPPIKSLAFEVPSNHAESSQRRHVPQPSAGSTSPVRPPKSLLRTPGKPRFLSPGPPESMDVDSPPRQQYPATTTPAAPPPSRLRQPSPKHVRSMSPVPNPFLEPQPTTRAPLSILEERPMEDPEPAPPEKDMSSWKPQLPSRTVMLSVAPQTISPPPSNPSSRGVPLPLPSPVHDAVALHSSPMKVDGASFDRHPDASFRTISLDSPHPATSPALPRADTIREEVDEEEIDPPQEDHIPRQPISDSLEEPLEAPVPVVEPPSEPPPLPISIPAEVAAPSAIQPDALHASSSRAASKAPARTESSISDATSAAMPNEQHYDVVVPLNDGEGSSRQSLFKRASQASAARQSGGQGLRRSTFARAFAPRSRVVSSGPGDALAAATAVEQVNAIKEGVKGKGPETVATQGTKRKSTAIEDAGEIERVADVPVPHKVQKVEASDTPSAATAQFRQKSLPASPPHSEERDTPAGLDPSEDLTSDPTNPTDVDPDTMVTPSASGTDVSSKTPLAALAALAQGLATGARPTMGRTSGGSTGSQRRAPSLHPETHTFNMRELMGADYQPTPAKSGSSRSASPDEYSDDITPDDVVEVVSQHARPGEIIFDAEDNDDDDGAMSDGDNAVTFNKDSFTPENSPPRSVLHSVHSVPGALPELAGQKNVLDELIAEATSPRTSPKARDIQRGTSITSERTSPVASTSGSSFLSAARAAVTGLFRPSPQPAPTPFASSVVAPAPIAPLSGSGGARPLTRNPFTRDPSPPQPRVTVNPFTNSPVKPLPAPPAEDSQQTQQTQSTALSSQATGASFFDSQPFSRRASYEGASYETDITESAFGESQLGKPAGRTSIFDDEPEIDEVAAALAQTSPDASMHMRRSLPEDQPSPVPQVTAAPENIPASAPAPRPEPRSIPVAGPSKTRADAPTPAAAKTLKHVPSMMSLASKNKVDAQRVASQTTESKRTAGPSSVPAKKASPPPAAKKPSPPPFKKLSPPPAVTKEATDSKKRQREEPTTSSNGAALKKVKSDEESSKKRKMEVEVKTKPKAAHTLKSTSSIPNLAAAKQPFRPPFKAGFKPVSSMASSSTSKPPGGGLPTKSQAASGSSMRPPPQMNHGPQAQIQAKMQASLEAQIAKEKKAQQLKMQQDASRKAEPEPEEDEFELPDIASEYSNSDDEDRPSKVLADWAEPDQLVAALRRQEQDPEIDPDEIFGPIGEPNLEQFFGPKNKFRVRSSSANWGTSGDGLTKDEIAEYSRRIGHSKQ